MLRIEVTHTFDVCVAEAFAYITDMKNWPEYWPNFIRIEIPAAAGWSNPGDRATVVIKLLNRERALNMELEAFQKDACVTYVSRQRGLPDVRHERHFEAARDRCVYRLIVEYEPRSGFAGLFDRTLVRRSVEQAMRRTVQNLDRRLWTCIATDSGGQMATDQTALRVAGAWLAGASLLLVFALAFHGPLHPDLEVQMRHIAESASRWAAVHWTAAAAFSSFTIAAVRAGEPVAADEHW